MASGLFAAGWPVLLQWEVIARPLPDPLRRTVGAVVSGRLKAAAAMPVPGSAAGTAAVPHQAPGPDRTAPHRGRAALGGRPDAHPARVGRRGTAAGATPARRRPAPRLQRRRRPLPDPRRRRRDPVRRTPRLAPLPAGRMPAMPASTLPSPWPRPTTAPALATTPPAARVRTSRSISAGTGASDDSADWCVAAQGRQRPSGSASAGPGRPHSVRPCRMGEWPAAGGACCAVSQLDWLSPVGTTRRSLPSRPETVRRCMSFPSHQVMVAFHRVS